MIQRSQLLSLSNFTYKDSNLPFILNIDGVLEGFSYRIENISISCSSNFGCPNFINGIKGTTNIEDIFISNIKYHLVDQ